MTPRVLFNFNLKLCFNLKISESFQVLTNSDINPKKIKLKRVNTVLPKIITIHPEKAEKVENIQNNLFNPYLCFTRKTSWNISKIFFDLFYVFGQCV